MAGNLLVSAVVGLLLLELAFAGNPLVKDVGMADPHLRVSSDGTFLLFATHDFAANNTG